MDDEHINHPDYFAHWLRWQHVWKYLWSTTPHDLTIGDDLKSSILDVGCGDFPLLKFLYRNNFSFGIREYCGIDIRDLSKELETIPTHHIFKFSRRFLQHDCSTEIPIQGRWDVIVCFETLEHMGKDDGIKMLHNLLRLMDKETVLFLSTPCFYKSKASNHIYEWEYAELEQQLKTEFVIDAVFGTFALQRIIKPVLTKDELSVFEKLRVYYHSNLISVIMAPLHPKQSRNCLWQLKCQ